MHGNIKLESIEMKKANNIVKLTNWPKCNKIEEANKNRQIDKYTMKASSTVRNCLLLLQE